MAAIPDPVQTAYETAAAQRTLSLPTIPEELRALEADDLRGGAEEPLEAIDASGLIIADENFSELQAAHARFANCFLSCCDFSGSLFTDTVFEGCDFANSYFDGAGFTRCTFKNCKLTGASFMEANLEHVALEDCTLDFGAFNRCRFWAVSATRCDFSGADMAETTTASSARASSARRCSGSISPPVSWRAWRFPTPWRKSTARR